MARGTVLQLKIIDLWVGGMKNNDIAKECKCSLQTIFNTKADPELKRMYYERCNAQIEELVPMAIKRLTTILQDDSVQASVHISAVKEVLDRSHLKELLEHSDKNINISISYE